MTATLPRSVRDAIRDPLVLGDGPSPTWTPPAELPPVADVRAALAALRTALKPTKAKDARWCLGKLRQRFGVGSTAGDAERWLGVLGKFPRDLLFDVTRQAVGADDRPTLEAVAAFPGLARRRTELARAEAILARITTPRPVTPFRREPLEVRLRTLLRAAEARRDGCAAARYERELAALEGREPEVWALPMPSGDEEKPAAAPVSIVPASPRNAATMLRAAARFHRQRSRADYADLLDARADALSPHVDVVTDVPETEHGEAA